MQAMRSKTSRASLHDSNAGGGGQPASDVDSLTRSLANLTQRTTMNRTQMQSSLSQARLGATQPGGQSTNSNNAASDESQSASLLRMQRSQIDKLKKDNDRLREGLATETRSARISNNQSSALQLTQLQDQLDLYSRRCESEKSRIATLDKDIQRMSQEVLTYKKEFGGLNSDAERTRHTVKHITTLENRLDKALIKFNQALAYNKQLRLQIDNLRRERVQFDAIYRKLDKELADKKRRIASIVRASTVHYEQRDAAYAEMNALKRQADEEQKRFEQEWQTMGQIIDADRNIKQQQQLQQQQGVDGTMVQYNPSATSLSSSAIDTENSLKRAVTKSAWLIARDKANIHLSMEKVQNYEESFAKIQSATGIQDIDELVSIFVHSENQNFVTFNRVNALQSECDAMAKQCQAVQAEIDKFKGKSSSSSQLALPPVGEAGQSSNQPIPLAQTEEKLKSALLESYNASILNTSDESQHYEAKYALATENQALIASGIGAIAQQLQLSGATVGGADVKSQAGQASTGGSSTALVPSSAGASAGYKSASVHSSDLLSVLGSIESEVHHLLRDYTVLQQADERRLSEEAERERKRQDYLRQREEQFGATPQQMQQRQQQAQQQESSEHSGDVQSPMSIAEPSSIDGAEGDEEEEDVQPLQHKHY